MKQLCCGLAAFGLLFGAVEQVRSDFIYWCEFNGGVVQRANLDGSGKTTLVRGLSVPLFTSLDLPDGTMYWSENGKGNVWRANLDGSEATTIVSGVSSPSGTALDIGNRQIYWVDGTFGVGGIQRANFDGSGLTTLVSGASGPRGICLDLLGGKMYFSEGLANQEGFISRYNLDGSGRETLLRGLSLPTQMSLDLAAGKIYWADANSFTIRRANLDGSDPEILIQRGSEIPGLALDLAAGKMYWSGFVSGMIERANLDGTGQEVLLRGLNAPVGIALDLSAPVSQLLISAPSNATAGSPFDVTVTAADSNGNVVPGYTGTVTFISTDPYPAVLPANYTFTSSDQGSHTFSGGVTLFTAGAQTLTVQDTANSALTGSATVTVGAGASALLVVSAPASAIAGSPFNVTVTVLDSEGNVVTGYTGTVVVTSSELNPQPTDHTFTASDSGSYVFSATLFSAGVQTVEARDAANGALAGTATVTVQAAPANQLLLTAPANVSAGMPFDMILTALDPYGNTDTSYQGTLAFSTSDANPGVMLPAPYTFTTGNGGDNGLHDFAAQVTLLTPGDQTLTATDTVSGITVSATVTVQ